jgi:hypothetical protein
MNYVMLGLKRLEGFLEHELMAFQLIVLMFFVNCAFLAIYKLLSMKLHL